jgi:hypothetical protein
MLKIEHPRKSEAGPRNGCRFGLLTWGFCGAGRVSNDLGDHELIEIDDDVSSTPSFFSRSRHDTSSTSRATSFVSTIARSRMMLRLTVRSRRVESRALVYVEF